MADKPDSEDDWRLREWLAWFGKRQASLVNELGWTKNRAHIVWHSDQPYRRQEVNLIARWLGIKPFELLMTPREAMALRALRQSAQTIVAEDTNDVYEVAPPDPHPPLKTGTKG